MTLTHSLVVNVSERCQTVATLNLKQFRKRTKQMTRLVERARAEFDSEASLERLVGIERSVHSPIVLADRIVSPAMSLLQSNGNQDEVRQLTISPCAESSRLAFLARNQFPRRLCHPCLDPDGLFAVLEQRARWSASRTFDKPGRVRIHNHSIWLRTYNLVSVLFEDFELCIERVVFLMITRVSMLISGKPGASHVFEP